MALRLILRVASVHVDDKAVAGVLAVILQDAFHVEVLVELPVRVAVAHQEELGAPGFGEFGARKVDELAAEFLALPLGHNDDQVELALGILVARGGKAIGRGLFATVAKERALEFGIGGLCHLGCLGEHLVVAGYPRGVGTRLAVLEDSDAAGGDNAALCLGDERDGERCSCMAMLKRAQKSAASTSPRLRSVLHHSWL